MRDIVFITVDSLRADHVGAYGYDRDTSPYLDSLAKSNYQCTNAFAHAGATRASFPAIFTSTYPLMFGGFKKVSKKRTLISEVLDDAGYNTGGFHSNPFLSEDFGYDRGFDILSDSQTDPSLLTRARDFVVKNLPRDTKVFKLLQTVFEASEKHAGVEMGSAYVRADELTDRALEWLNKADDRPTFLWTHYMDVHHPYVPPAAYQEEIAGRVVEDRRSIQLRRKMLESPEDISDDELQTLVDLYDAEIRFVDDQIERLVDEARSEMDDPVIVFTADHGEEFREHGQFSHNTVHTEGIHVPLIIDDGSGTEVLDEVVGLMDIAPAFATYADQPIPETYCGFDLTDLLHGQEWQREAVVGNFGSSDFDQRHYFYRDTEWLYIRDDREELYNIVEGPNETENVVKTKPESLQEIRDHVDECDQKIVSTHQVLDEVSVDKEVNERLKMLGYKNE